MVLRQNIHVELGRILNDCTQLKVKHNNRLYIYNKVIINIETLRNNKIIIF